MKIDYQLPKFSQLKVKKCCKNLQSLDSELKNQVCLFKIIEHGKLKYIKYLPDTMKNDLMCQSDIKFYNLKIFYKQQIRDKNIDLLVSFINNKEHYQMLCLLERFCKDKYYTFAFRRILKQHKIVDFEDLDIYIRKNMYVPKLVSAFLDLYKEFLPKNFANILWSSNINIAYFEKCLSCKWIDFSNIRISEDDMRYNFMREKALNQDFELNTYLIKYVKRDDIEFFLRMKKYNMNEYFSNNVASDHKSYPHMVLYNLLTKYLDVDLLLKKEYTNNITGFVLPKKKEFYAILSRVNYLTLFVRNIDVLLLEIIFSVICLYKDYLCMSKIIEANIMYKKLDSCIYFSLVNSNEIAFLKDNIEKIVLPDRFLVNEFNFDDMIKYYNTNLKNEVIKKAASLPLKVIIDHLLAKYEDERDAYYESLLYKITDTSESSYKDSKENFVELRIFDIESQNEFFCAFKEKYIELVESNIIFEKLKSTKLFFKYCMLHKKYLSFYIKSIDFDFCTIEEAQNIYKILSINKDYNIENRNCGNIPYKVAVSHFNDLDAITDDKIQLVNYVYHIRNEDGIFLFFQNYYDLITFYIQQKSNLNKGKKLADLNYMNYLQNKYLVYCLDLEPHILKNVLKFIPYLDYKYIKILIRCLNDTNIECVTEAKRLLKTMKCTNPDVDQIKSQIVESFVDKMNAKNTFITIMTLQFSYMIDNTSLYLIIELCRKYIKDYKEYVFCILRKIKQIVINTEYFTTELFQILSLFVVQTNYYMEECIDLVRINISKLEISEFDVLFDNINADLKTSFFIVEVLKIINDDNLSNQAFASKLKNGEAVKNTPNFLAYAFSLDLFYKYFDDYFSILKKIYESNEKQIAIHAFSKILKKGNSTSDAVFEYITHQSFTEVSTRLHYIEVLSSQNLCSRFITVLYIYKFDSNSNIRKRVVEILKNEVENYNVLIKSIYDDIFRYLEIYYDYIPEIAENVVIEVIKKYTNCIDIKCIVKYEKMHPLFLSVGLKHKKYVDESKRYVKLCKIPGENYAKILNILFGLDREFVFELAEDTLSNKNKLDYNNMCNAVVNVLKSNRSHIYSFLMTHEEFINHPELLELLNNEEKKNIFIYITSNLKKFDAALSFLLESTEELDIKNYDVNMIYKYLKSSSSLDLNLYKKVFRELNNDLLQDLISEHNYKCLLYVSYENITEYEKLIDVLCSQNTIASLERLYEIYNRVNDDNKRKIVYFFLYNFLIYENRSFVQKIFQSIQILDCEVINEIIQSIVN